MKQGTIRSVFRELSFNTDRQIKFLACATEARIDEPLTSFFPKKDWHFALEINMKAYVKSAPKRGRSPPKKRSSCCFGKQK